MQIESSLSGVFQIQKPDINLICTQFVHCPVPYAVDLENFFEIHSLIIPVLEYPADKEKHTNHKHCIIRENSYQQESQAGTRLIV